MENPFELVVTRSGAMSIRNVALNQTMHGPVGPAAEANGLYIVPSKLRERLGTPNAEELVVFDVGLGAAANALAAIRAALELKDACKRRLRVVSFETDLELLVFALKHFDSFPHFAGFREAIEAILTDHKWASPCGIVHWELRVGDFLETVVVEPYRPTIIFHDPYSSVANETMWNVACFDKIRRAIGDADEPTSLHTYSCSTPVRAALLLANFYVGMGPKTGMKESTTQASTHLDALDSPLGEAWLQRWGRSHTRYPLGTATDDYQLVDERVRAHPQFQGL